MLLAIPKDDWDPDLEEIVYCFFGHGDVTIYKANVGYRVVASTGSKDSNSGGPVLCVGEDNGVCGTAFYYDRSAGYTDWCLGVCLGVDKEIDPMAYRPLVAGINVHTRLDILNCLREKLVNPFNSERAINSMVDIILSGQGCFECLSDVITVMIEKHCYPFSVNKQVVWLN